MFITSLDLSEEMFEYYTNTYGDPKPAHALDGSQCGWIWGEKPEFPVYTDSQGREHGEF
jgi:hypothetical protein